MSQAEPLRVVVTNDDGIDSEGLRLLAAAALRTGCKVLVAAPDHEASGSSAAMTAVRDDGRIVMERRKLAELDAVLVFDIVIESGVAVLHPDAPPLADEEFMQVRVGPAERVLQHQVQLAKLDVGVHLKPAPDRRPNFSVTFSW